MKYKMYTDNISVYIEYILTQGGINFNIKHFFLISNKFRTAKQKEIFSATDYIIVWRILIFMQCSGIDCFAGLGNDKNRKTPNRNGIHL